MVLFPLENEEIFLVRHEREHRLPGPLQNKIVASHEVEDDPIQNGLSILLLESVEINFLNVCDDKLIAVGALENSLNLHGMDQLPVWCIEFLTVMVVIKCLFYHIFF